MEGKTCIDTNVIIDLLNGQVDKNLKVNNNIPYITVFNLFELSQRTKNIEQIIKLRKLVEIIEFNERAAIIASNITKNLKSEGKMSQKIDIFIAACCIANDCSLLTGNKKHFENIKGLKLA